MKKNLSLLIIQLLFITVSSYSQNVEILRFEGKFSPQNKIIDTEDKQVHLRSSHSAQITPVYDESQMRNFHPLASQIIKQAIGKWEKKIYIPADKEINISFVLDKSDSSVAYTADIPFKKYNNIGYPLPLCIANFGLTPKEVASIGDIVISINSDPSLWFFGGDEDNPNISADQYDFETGMLRALAHCFGFGSSIEKRRPSFKPFFTIFDQFIINSDNTKLIDVNKGNIKEVTSYVTGNNVYWKNGDTRYKLYARNPYDQYLSLKYFDSENELMSADLTTANRNIDSKVTKVMEDIGWTLLLENPLAIKSNNLNNTTGLGNASASYSFYYESAHAVSRPSWKYMIRKKDNTYETIKTGTSTTFSISPLAVKDYYHRNENGDFCGKIVLTADVNGSSVTTEFNAWLEAKPAKIEYDIKIIKESEWYYNMEITAYSAGAKDLIVALTDYSIGEQLTEIFYDKQYAKYTYNYLYYDSPVLIEFTSRNSYGTGTESYYTDGISYSDYRSFSSSIQGRSEIAYTYKDVYSLTGKYELKLSANESLETSNLKSGCYIIKTVYPDGTSRFEKVYKKP